MDLVAQVSNYKTETYYGHQFQVRSDINAFTYSKDLNVNETDYGLVVNHNHYLDGFLNRGRNYETTLYKKNDEHYDKVYGELNVLNMVQNMSVFDTRESNKDFDFGKLSYNLLMGNLESETVTSCLEVCKLFDVYQNEGYNKEQSDDTYQKYKKMWYDGLLPRGWMGLLLNKNAVYYVKMKRLPSWY